MYYSSDSKNYLIWTFAKTRKGDFCQNEPIGWLFFAEGFQTLIPCFSTFNIGGG